VDTARLRASWARVTGYGTAVPQFFYARLFLAHPHLRELFPVSMAAQSDRLVGALGRIVSNVDDLAPVVPVVQQLGQDHRKFGVREEHYPLVGEALLATLAHFLGTNWTPELESDWTEAYTVVAATMTEAAAAAGVTSPPWWEAEIVLHERRGFDVALLRIRPQPAYPYRPGQSIAVETPMRPRVWRPYSPANAPRADGTIDLHIKAVPGGQVSNALVGGAVPGDRLRLGAPVGTRLTLDHNTGRDLLLLAGGTGAAPFKALIEELAATDRPRQVALYVGARTAPDLYDLPALERMAQRLSWLTVVPVLSHDPYALTERGGVVEVALGHQAWPNREVYVCGPDGMVSDALTRLVAAGVPLDRIHTEDYDSDPDRAGAARAASSAMEVPTL
jgi:NAD(P)H-flavin reductase/hemoglobin-like flavoprotein